MVLMQSSRGGMRSRSLSLSSGIVWVVSGGATEACAVPLSTHLLGPTFSGTCSSSRPMGHPCPCPSVLTQTPQHPPHWPPTSSLHPTLLPPSSATRIILCKKTSDPIAPLLQNLPGLPTARRINPKLVGVVFQANACSQALPTPWCQQLLSPVLAPWGRRTLILAH